MSTRGAINGFGRIGRAFLRSAIERNADLEVVAVHDVANADVLAQLLERDSIHGRFAHPVRVEDGALVVADRRIKVVEPEDREPTNCLAPVAKVLHETVGIRHGLITAIHAYTADQQLLDAPHKDLRRARAAALNLVPTSTGAAKALGLVIPELEGRLHGIAVRVPVPTGSLVDLTVEAERATSVEEVNAAFRLCADSGPMTGILAYSEDPIVSSDIVKSPYSSIYDAPLTSVMNETQVKVVAWYDNEWGYASRLVELAALVMVPVADAPASAHAAAL